MKTKTGFVPAIAILLGLGLSAEVAAESRERGIGIGASQQQPRAQRNSSPGFSFFEIFGGIGNSGRRSNRPVFESYGEPSGQYRQQKRRYVAPEGDSSGAPIYTYRADPLVALGDTRLTQPVPADAAPGSAARLDDSLAQTIFEQLQSGGSGTRVTKAQRDAIVDFYRKRDFAPVWASLDSIAPKARKVLDLFVTADLEGLDPGDYLPSALNSYSSDHRVVETAIERLAEFDIGMTAMALRYAMHASGGRIIANRLSGYYDVNPPAVLPTRALERLAAGDDPSGYLATLHPPHPAYRALKAALLEELSAGQKETAPPIPAGGLIRIGDIDPRVPAIRDRLQDLGALDGSDDADAAGETPSEDNDLGTGVARNLEDQVYDRDLARAVRKFQARSGLSQDGIIGSRTLAVLNGERITNHKERLVYNMERLRWLPRNLGKRHVFVNQAAYEVKVIDSGRTIWTSRVIVGKPRNQTFVFSDEIETVEFNPYWGVPQSIIRHEMIPRLVNDPGYLDRLGYEVFNASGRKVSSHAVNWWDYDAGAPVAVRQPPGRSNALGEIKFLFPNKHAIYMHDTPMRKLFSRPVRAFSHGCVRVQDPRRFAEIVLGWDQADIAGAIASGENMPVRLKNKLPVHLAYFTAWPDETGKVRYLSDIYGRDRLLERAFGVTQTAMR